MKKKKEKKKRKEKTGPVQLSKVCWSQCEALFYFSPMHLIHPIIEMFIGSPVWSLTSRNLSLLLWTVRKYKRLLSAILHEICTEQSLCLLISFQFFKNKKKNENYSMITGKKIKMKIKKTKEDIEVRVN